MILTVDTSAVMAVLLDEPQKEKLIELTDGVDLLAPPSLTWEIGNALTALLKRGRISMPAALRCMTLFEEIPVRLAEIDPASALMLAGRHGIYAYDAYVLECARKYRTSLLSLDKGQCRIATVEGINLVEVNS